MLTTNYLLIIIGCAIAAFLYAFNAFFRARISAMLLFISGWMVFIAGFVGTAIEQDMPKWAWFFWVAFVGGYFYAIRSEYKLWRKSQSK